MFFFEQCMTLIQRFSSKIQLQLKNYWIYVLIIRNILVSHFSQCEIAGFGSLNGVEVAVCEVKCVNLKVNTIKILGIHFSYNNKFNMKKNFLTTISNIIEKVITFKTLALPKIIHLCLSSAVSKQIIEEIENMQEIFL